MRRTHLFDGVKKSARDQKKKTQKGAILPRGRQSDGRGLTAKMIRQDINPTLSNESSSAAAAAAASSSGNFALGFSGFSSPHRHIQENALKRLQFSK